MGNMKKIILTAYFLMSILLLVAQDSNLIFDQETLKYDTSRITDYREKLNIYGGFFGKIHSIELNNSDINKKLRYEPNSKTSIGLGFNYKWIGLAVAFSPGFLNSDNNIYGETESFDMQLNLYSRTFGVDGYLQYYKGYYLKNPEDFTTWANEAYPLRPDLESLAIGLSGYYFTNHKKFSYKAAYNRTQVQKKSAGSWIMGIYANVNTASVPGEIIPVEFSDTLRPYYNVEGYKTGSVGFSGGYTYTVVLKRFFMNGTLVPGLGIRNGEYWSNGINNRQETTVTASVTFRLAIGYEGKKMYAGISMVSLVDSYNYESIEVASSSGNARIYIGKRFNVNRFKKHK